MLSSSLLAMQLLLRIANVGSDGWPMDPWTLSFIITRINNKEMFYKLLYCSHAFKSVARSTIKPFALIKTYSRTSQMHVVVYILIVLLVQVIFRTTLHARKVLVLKLYMWHAGEDNQ